MRFGKTVSRRLGPAGLPITIAALSLIVAFAASPEISDAGFRLTHDDPADIADHTLARTFTRDVADRQIRTALDEGDIDLANSFAELARDRRVSVEPSLAVRLEAANSTGATVRREAGSFVHGLITGQPEDTAGMIGTGVGDLFVFGDVRDATREGLRLARGEVADEAVLGLACVGIAVTAGLPAWAAAVVLAAAVAVHSVGEMCHAAAVFALSFELAPAHAQSEYVGLQDMGLGAAFAVAPAVLGALCLGLGQGGWVLLGGLLTVAGMVTVPIVGWAIRSRPFLLEPPGLVAATPGREAA